MSASFRSILSHTAIFLSGIFIALLISTAQLTSYHDHHDVGGSSSLQNALSESIRGGGAPSSSIKELQSRLIEEQRKMLELHSQTSQHQNSSSVIDTGSSDSHSQSTSSSTTQYLREKLLQSYNNNINKQHFMEEDICSILPKPTPTTLSLWSSHLSSIFNASKHSADSKEYIFHDFTAQLLNIMTPDRLQRSVKTLPLDWTPVERSLDILYKRLMAIQSEVDNYKKEKNLKSNEDIVPEEVMKRINTNAKLPRKLNVLVMGGSVTMGVVCHINPVTSATGKYSRRNCAWPGRLGHFFSQLFLGYELIDFHTLALGGTNTESGITMWDYSLLPGDVPYPDIVINAYATNDMHYNSVQDAIAKNISLQTSVLQLSQEFIRQVLTPKAGCRHAPPLLIYLDDYLGNEQNEIMTTLLSPQVINLMSGYYGIASMSYGDAVRDIVYGDTKEWWFSSHWYEKGTYGRAVHPHMGMHISMIWVVAFNLMNLMTTYCSLPPAVDQLSTGESSIRHRRHHAGVEGKSKGVWDYGYKSSKLNGLPTLRDTKQLEGGPRQKPRGIPPPLTESLSLEHVTQLWQDDSNTNAHLWKTSDECKSLGQINDNASHESLSKPCIYSWVANLERRLDNPQRITDKIKPYMTSNEGWSAADDNNKLGWVPSGIGSKFRLEFKKISQPIRAVTWMIMRSYGEKWEGSMLRVEVSSNDKIMAKQDIEGTHNKKTSETYNIKMKLEGDGVAVGSDVKITFELVGGSTFKISGMAICVH